MVFSVTVSYPNDPDTKFDVNYYVSKHIPLVEKYFKSAGLQKYSVVQYDAQGKSKDEVPYVLQAILEWPDQASVEKAFNGEEGKPVLEDVPNFTNKQAIVYFGQQIASSS